MRIFYNGVKKRNGEKEKERERGREREREREVAKRLEALRHLQDAHMGYEEGLYRLVFSKRQSGHHRRNYVPNPVADRLIHTSISLLILSCVCLCASLR